VPTELAWYTPNAIKLRKVQGLAVLKGLPVLTPSCHQPIP